MLVGLFEDRKLKTDEDDDGNSLMFFREEIYKRTRARVGFCLVLRLIDEELQ